MTHASVRRVGLFGGAFDPPHRAHMALAQAAVAQLQLDVLHVVPTGVAWHKARPLSAARHRVSMCQLAFAGMSGVVVDTREIDRQGATYTIDTLHELRQQYGAAALYLVVGEDQAGALPTWHRIDDIGQMATICVARRTDAGPMADSASGAAGFTQPVRTALHYLQFPVTELSSSGIRSTVAQGRVASHLVAEPVARYIDTHHLYQED